MTTPITPPYAGSLLALVGADSPVDYFGTGFLLLDVGNDRAFFLEFAGTTAEHGLKQFTVGIVGTETAQATALTTFGDAGDGTPNHAYATGGICYHPMGKIFCAVDEANSAPIAMIDADTLLADAVVGIQSSSFSPSTNDDGGQKRFLFSFQMVPLQTSGGNFIVSRGHEFEVGLFNVDNGTISVSFAEDIDEDVARLGPGKNGTDIYAATFHVIGDAFSRAGGSTTPVQFYQYVVDASGGNVFKRSIRSISPADIDATWANFSVVSNPGYDQADDTVLCFFSTIEAVTHTDYLVKLNPLTGAIIWATPVANGFATNVDLPQSNINGALGYIEDGSPATLTLLNLATAVATVQDWNSGFSASLGSQVWDYQTGSLTCSGSYTEGTGPIPTYQGEYLADNGDVIPSQRWMRVFSGQSYIPLNGGGGTSPGSAPQRAWTYVLDGHTCYVLDLDAEGTFVYDTVTQHWSKFITGAGPLWNMAVGCMWKNRVLAGDRATGDVWEMSPNATLDNDVSDIARIVSGLVTRRSRDFVGIGALRIAASSGVLSGDGTATFNLRYSDDQGQTWQTAPALTLTPSDFSQEIAFRALGSFAAPGRLFELSDSGGLVRIDNCAIDPELDEDEHTET